MKKFVCGLLIGLGVAVGFAAGALCMLGDWSKSSYQLAVKNGFDGTEKEWLASLKGENGSQGELGPVGPEGPAGKNGARWYSGNQPPKDDFGATGDYYLDFENCAVYEKTDSGWTVRGALDTSGIPLEREFVELTLDANGGELPEGVDEKQRIGRGNSLELPVPVRQGYRFVGWFYGEGANRAQADALTVFSRNLTLTAEWQRELKVTLKVETGALSVGSRTLFFVGCESGAEITLTVEKEGEERPFKQDDDWISSCAFLADEDAGDGNYRGYVAFAGAGTYILHVHAEKDGLTAEASYSVIVTAN